MVYVLLGTGFEEIEAMTPVDLLRRAGIQVQTVGLNGKIVYGSHGIGIEADISPAQMALSQMDMLVLPGGLGGVKSIRESEAAMAAIAYAHDHDKYLAAICAGPTILAAQGLLEGKQAVCYPGCEDQMAGARMVQDLPCVQDGRIITGASAGCAREFALTLIEALAGPEAAKKIAGQIVIR